ncbi:CorA2 [Desulforapulum autotrophicum HRM2]|uniref:Magnesium transport protein CorA n=1 Tax=Desulforapulum autotrophicum (strain ATCC 43914 / DSM 3382 / VKM B-1955 / HRM2) TaxID=177437 RepID=C0QAW8_DESAH|nr:magnesium/cobalt transporter CorA [Desulforapulum autotrophicum]ACN16901.1 CorA2 [Desulforapulum autotrophicum HRM2]
MARFLKKRTKALGQSPGDLIFIGNQKMESVQLRLIDYDTGSLTDQELLDIKDGSHFKETKTVTWININGLHDLDVIKDVGRIFELHPLVLEDILNTGQRPKIEEFDTYLFIALKMIRFDRETETVINEQLGMVLGKNYLLTFQEQRGDVFEPVRKRIKRDKSRLRGSGTDYLAYALIDTVVDNYIYIIELIGERIEDLEETLLVGHDTEVMEKINAFKREINYLRKSIRPAREAILQLSRLDGDLIHENTLPFIKDLQDLMAQATEAIDTYRDLLSDQLNIYNSVMANKMNDIMKVLTIFAAIFIPLTFVAGIYGTNFEYLPELHYKYSYFIFWAIMIIIAGGLILFFKRKRWL